MEWILFWGVIFGLILFGVARSTQNAAEEKARIEIERQRKEAVQRKNEADFVEWVEKRQNEGWAYVARGKLMHLKQRPECTMAMSRDAPLLRFDKFELVDELRFDDPFYLNLNQIISLNVASPRVTKTRYESVPVPITTSKNKSPVARGLLGGALLGPAGLVVGAASGLNAMTETEIRHETVSRKYESRGAPQLIIGTTSDDYPVLKFRCASQEVADEWMFRIRGRQARGG